MFHCRKLACHTATFLARHYLFEAIHIYRQEGFKPIEVDLESLTLKVAKPWKER
jgi:hypothetical protein